MNDVICEFGQAVIDGRLLERNQIELLSEQSMIDFEDLLYWSNKIREKYFGNHVKVCSIVPGRLGGCSQDCAFCAQSVRYDTAVSKTPEILTDEEILLAGRAAADAGVANFGIVYSGKAVTEGELDRIAKLSAKIRTEYGIGICASLGIISTGQAQKLFDAGVRKYNHNLETSERYFAEIVTTHTYRQRVDTVKSVKAAGMEVCCGGIFGIGETEQDRIDMALEIRGLNVEMVPMNFLHPIEGTPLGNVDRIKPKEILRIIALYRFILPGTELKAAGGRVLNLRDMQSWIFRAGTTSILTGNYLTTAGRSVQEDMQMVTDLGLEVFSV